MKYYALLTTTMPQIYFLEGCETFDQADEACDKMMKQGEVIPYIMDEEEVKFMIKHMKEVLGQ